MPQQQEAATAMDRSSSDLSDGGGMTTASAVAAGSGRGANSASRHLHHHPGRGSFFSYGGTIHVGGHHEDDGDDDIVAGNDNDNNDRRRRVDNHHRGHRVQHHRHLHHYHRHRGTQPENQLFPFSTSMEDDDDDDDDEYASDTNLMAMDDIDNNMMMMLMTGGRRGRGGSGNGNGSSGRSRSGSRGSGGRRSRRREGYAATEGDEEGQDGRDYGDDDEDVSQDDNDGSQDDGLGDPSTTTLATSRAAAAAATAAAWRERERRQRTIRFLMMFLFVLLLLDGEDMGNQQNIGNNNGNNNFHQHLRSRSSQGGAGDGGHPLTMQGKGLLGRRVYLSRQLQDQRIRSLALQHKRYYALIKKNGGENVEKQVYHWAKQHSERQQLLMTTTEAESSLPPPPPLSNIVAREIGNDDDDVSSGGGDDPEADRKVYHYPWNTTGFYRGEWSILARKATPSSSSASTTAPATAEPMLVGGHPGNETTRLDDVGDNIGGDGDGDDSKGELLVDPRDIEDMMLRKLYHDKGGDTMGVISLPKGYKLRLRDDNNLTTLRWEEYRFDSRGRVYKPSPLVTTTAMTTIPGGESDHDASPGEDGEDAYRKEDGEASGFDGSNVSPRVSLEHSNGRAAFQLFTRSIPAMKEISLVDGFIRLCDTSTQAFTTKKDMLLRVRGVLIHTLGKLSLISNVDHAHSAFVMRSVPDQPKAEENDIKKGDRRRRLEEMLLATSRYDGGHEKNAAVDIGTIRDDVVALYGGVLNEENEGLAPEGALSDGQPVSRDDDFVVAWSSAEGTGTDADVEVAAAVAAAAWSSAAEEVDTIGTDSTAEFYSPSTNAPDGGDDLLPLHLDASESRMMNEYRNYHKARLAGVPRSERGDFSLQRGQGAPIAYNDDEVLLLEEEQQDDNFLPTESLPSGASALSSAAPRSSVGGFSFGDARRSMTTASIRASSISSVSQVGVAASASANSEATQASTMMLRDPFEDGPVWSDLVVPFPFVRDDRIESIRRQMTHSARLREQELEANAAGCSFEINLNVNPVQWTVGSWRQMLSRYFNEVRKLNPATMRRQRPIQQQQGDAVLTRVARKEHNSPDSMPTGTEDMDADATGNDSVRRRLSVVDPSSLSNVGRRRRLASVVQDQALVMSMTGTIYSPNCDFYAALNATAIRTDLDKMTSKAINYSFYMMLVCLIQILILLRQLLHSQAQSAATRVSLLCIGWQTVIDALLCLAHIYLSLAIQSLFTAFASVSFFKLLIFCVIEMKYMAIILHARNNSNGQQQQTTEALRRQVAMLHLRFYVALLGTFILMYYITDDHRMYFMMGLYSFWVPQIIMNIVTEAKNALHTHYIYCISLTRLVVPIYVFGIRNNFIKEAYGQTYLPYDPATCQVLILWVGLQTAILIAQNKYGTRFMIPQRFLPPKFDYNRPIPASLLPPEAMMECPPGGAGGSGGGSGTAADQQQQHQQPINGGSCGTVEDALLRPSPPTSGQDCSVDNEPDPPALVPTGRHQTADTTRNRIRGNRAFGGHRSSKRSNTMTTEEPTALEIAPPATLDCSICYEGIDVRNTRGYMLAPCNHLFHRQCLVQWMDVKMECPICRMELPSL